MDRRLGWIKDKYDARDFLFTPRIVKVPEEADLSGILPFVRDQGQVGSCVGFGIGANLCSVAIKNNIFTEWFSPTWIYNGARFIDGTLSTDSGSHPKDALDWLVKNGSLLEHFWPYNAAKFDPSTPSSERMSQAIKYANFSYYRVDNGLNGICAAISEGYCVSIGGPWFEAWFNAPNGILSDISATDYIAGGHETILYGYSLPKGKLYGMNSWGTNWGRSGFYEMPVSALDVFKQVGGYDAHYVVFDPGTAPPTPTPSTCKFGNGVASFLNIFQKVRNRRGRFYYLNP
jgi:hypothetical protein